MDSSAYPVIGLTSSVVTHNQIMSYHIHEKCVRSVIQAGGVPMMIPNGSAELIEVWGNVCDGIILSGGEDIDPYSFHAHPSPEVKETSPKRDETEIGLIRYALEMNKPILGLCRGMTMLNVALGGTVIQDIKSQHENAINHDQQTVRSEPTHIIEIDEKSRLFQIVGSKSYRVNSMHHQAIDKLASDLKVVAVAPDGMIEAVEGMSEEAPLIIGVQWHPEEMVSVEPAMQRLFEMFITECRRQKANG
ncbi:gamma-glutamyl-gamma-aminobutyrate hydrolase family protein [Halalkalibacter hemicellulosilyticus]|uniref:Glutamine amidotransferase n=1 Tax=Halalkalibacter hemicellulosilyticusJCM 9152 TaxID=1236971 RepID=W4QCR3_9BACI|nr:gamma-glutamyl-gamma-aminobutyrate hydrolase family protein [Halalkalibacter hemicellulosilyticus]GAE29443.1 glutamine amidotransferase [Halalkalibacter hemicellulosilyticusJCM 9152]